MEKGLIIDLFVSSTYLRPRTFGGGGHVFGDAREVTIVGIHEGGKTRPLPKGAQVFEPSERAPAALLVFRTIGGERIASIAPAENPSRHMSGGALADSSDSRWRQLVGFYGGVVVHDRYETDDRYSV